MTPITHSLRLHKTLYLSMCSTLDLWDNSLVSIFKKNLWLAKALDLLDFAVICVEWTQNQAILPRFRMFRHVG